MEPVGTWEWFWLFLLFSIPVVNVIAIIWMAVGSEKSSLANFCRAILLWFVVGLVLAILAGVLGL